MMRCVRTDRTTLCATCAVRLPKSDHCPTCDGALLFDLTRERSRQDALIALGKRAAEEEKHTWIGKVSSFYLRYVMTAVALLVFFEGFRHSDNAIAAFLLAMGALWVQLSLGFAIYAVIHLGDTAAKHLGARLGHRRRAPERLPRIGTRDDRDARATTEVGTIRGRVRVTTSMKSPLSHVPVAAFRLVGEGPLGSIDDAGGTSFEVVPESGAAARVDLDHGAVDLVVDDTPRVVRPDAGLKRFLAERGVFPDLGAIRLAEAVLRDGDEVVVEGPFEEVSGSDGYRGARTRKVFRERDGAPLVVRRADAPEIAP